MKKNYAKVTATLRQNISPIIVAIILLSATTFQVFSPVFFGTAKASPGDGRMLLFWDGGTAPTGWTCVSCTGGDPFFQTFIRGDATYGGTGGTTTHTHTASGTVDATAAAMPGRANAGTGINSNAHTHTFSPTIGSASNIPSYRQLEVIRYNSTGNPTTIPAGAIAFFDTSVPAGWTQYSAQNGYYVRGEGTAGTTGGSNTHTHSITATTSAPTGGAGARVTNSTQANVSSSTHTHSVSGNTASTNNEPPYVEVILGKLSSDSSLTNGMYAMWDNDPTTEWIVKSNSGGAMYQKFIKASSSYGTTGGATTHTPADVSFASGAAVGATTSRTPGTPAASSDTHTHTVHVTGFSGASSLPPYINVIIAKYQPPSTLSQSSYRWFTNSDSTDVGTPLAAQDTAAVAPKQGTPFRLRFTIHVSDSDRDINGAGLKLQYSIRSGSCDTGFSGESYSDVSPSSGAIRYSDNSSPSDAASLTTNANDPVHSGHTTRAQTYEEANNFTNTVSAIAAGEDGMWDASLVDFSATASTSYCFRVVRATDVQLEAYSVIPEIITDDGQGHMLLLWDGGSAPSGWSCVSCNSGETYYQKFLRGNTTAGGTAGSATSTHTANATIGASTEAGRDTAGTGVIENHTHTSTPTIAPAANLPVYRQLKVIRADSSGTPGTIPSGAITLFDAAVPSGWTRYSAQDGSYVRGEGTAGTTGGSNSHTHGISGSTSTGIGTVAAPDGAGGQAPVATDTHTHTYSGTSDSQSNEPLYIDTIFGKASSDTSVPTNMLAMWDNPIPGAWTTQSGATDPFYQKFAKPAATYGGTGGAATHTHGTTNLTSSGPSATVNSRTNTSTTSSNTHTHSVSINTFSAASNLPPYVDVIVAKLSGTNAAPNSPNSLDQIKVSTSGSISVGGWADDTQVRFSASLDDSDNPDDLSLCVEVEQVGTAFDNTDTTCGTSTSYSGAPVTATVTVLGLTDGADYHWQVRAKDGAGAYSSWVSFGGNAESAADFSIDDTNPSGTVYDGSAASVDVDYNDGSLDTLAANWDITDGGSGISLFEYSIGTTPGATDVVSWTSNGTTSSITNNSLTLQTSQVYYYNVRSTDVAGNVVIISSDGQLVAPQITFSVTSGGVTFNNLNAGNSFTDTETSTLTTSTNAHNGYEIRAYAEGTLQTDGGDSIPMFSGGTYAAPGAWLGGDTGYGYTSNDSSIGGVNIFSPATCLGGGSPPCYAPFATTGPGDIVADNQNTLSGTPITNESFIITHRVTTGSTQVSGLYQTVLVFSATAKY